MRFMQMHPKLQIELNFDDRYTNLVEQGIDVAIRMGGDPDVRPGGGNREMLDARTEFGIGDRMPGDILVGETGACARTAEPLRG